MTENDGGERSRWLGVSSAWEAELEGGQGPASTSHSHSPTWAANPLPPTLVGQGRGCTPAALKTINKDANLLVRAFLKKKNWFCMAQTFLYCKKVTQHRPVLQAAEFAFCRD